MKSIKNIILPLVFLATIFISCSDDDHDEPEKKEYDKIAYIVNYGNYGDGSGEVSTYDIASDMISQNSYKTANSTDFTSNIESMSVYNDIAYLMSNAGDKIDILDAATLEALGNPVSTDITKPRYFAATGNTAYISCWGEVNDWSVIANSYIAKMDLTTRSITKIPLPRAPEGVIIKDNKLYAALSTTNKVAVIDLSSEAISYIEVSAVPQQFVEDGNGNIWVSLVSKYSTPFPEDKLGLAIINPITNTVSGEVKFSQMGGNGLIQISSDKKTIYAMGAEAWPGTATTIYTVDVDNKSLSSTALISGEKFNGFNVSPDDNNIYIVLSPGATEAGSLNIHDPKGFLLSEQETGLSPKHVVFYEIEK